jgi:hypothetical protein
VTVWNAGVPFELAGQRVYPDPGSGFLLAFLVNSSNMPIIFISPKSSPHKKQLSDLESGEPLLNALPPGNKLSRPDVQLLVALLQRIQ